MHKEPQARPHETLPPEGGIFLSKKLMESAFHAIDRLEEARWLSYAALHLTQITDEDWAHYEGSDDPLKPQKSLVAKYVSGGKNSLSPDEMELLAGIDVCLADRDRDRDTLNLIGLASRDVATKLARGVLDETFKLEGKTYRIERWGETIAWLVQETDDGTNIYYNRDIEIDRILEPQSCKSSFEDDCVLLKDVYQNINGKWPILPVQLERRIQHPAPKPIPSPEDAAADLNFEHELLTINEEWSESLKYSARFWNKYGDLLINGIGTIEQIYIRDGQPCTLQSDADRIITVSFDAREHKNATFKWSIIESYDVGERIIAEIIFSPIDVKVHASHEVNGVLRVGTAEPDTVFDYIKQVIKRAPVQRKAEALRQHREEQVQEVTMYALGHAAVQNSYFYRQELQQKKNLAKTIGFISDYLSAQPPMLPKWTDADRLAGMVLLAERMERSGKDTTSLRHQIVQFTPGQFESDQSWTQRMRHRNKH